VLDDADVELGKTDIEPEQLTKRRDDRDRPLIGALHPDVILDHRGPKLLVDLLKPLADVINIPAVFAGMHEPIKKRLAFPITESTSIEKGARFVQHNNAIALFHNAILTAPNAFQIVGGRTIREAVQRSLEDGGSSLSR
jgi:hypothetical protein